MSTFEPFADSPFQIKREGEEITVTQTRLSPTSIRVSWTLPQNISCNMPAAYNGAIVTIDQTPTNLSKLPTDGSTYTADPSADQNLNTGSRLGTALVVGAFYNDTLTNHVDIFDAPANLSFYAAVHAVDNVYRYHTDGVFSYSLPYGKTADLPTSGYQILNIGLRGIASTTSTGLLAATPYTFSMCVDSNNNIPITIDGTDAQTFGDLVNALNIAFVNINNPVSSATQPLLNTYWYDTVNKALNQFNGTSYVNLPNTIVLNSDPLLPITGSYWLNTISQVLSTWDGTNYAPLAAYVYGRDPRRPYCNDYWFDGTNVHKWNGGMWILQTLISSQLDPALAPIMTCNMFWYVGGILSQWDIKTCTWLPIVVPTIAPTNPISGAMWFDPIAIELSMWDDVDGIWMVIPVSTSVTDPSLPPVLTQGTVWLDTIANAFSFLDGTSWTPVVPVIGLVKPQSIPDGSIWKNTTDGNWYILQMGAWSVLDILAYPTPPNIPVAGSYWINPVGNIVMQLNGGIWTPILASLSKALPTIGSYWYNPSNQIMLQWTGMMWSPVLPKAVASINSDGNIQITSSTTGSTSFVAIPSVGNLFSYGTLSQNITAIPPFVKGTDPVSTIPSYMQIGVGTDGSQDERRNMIEVIKTVLGYPAVTVELTKHAMDTAINMALEKLRSASSVPYKRGYFALDLQPRMQHYKLTDQTVGFHRIVDVLYVYRQTSTFLGTAAGNDVYGQMMVQNLFNMGKFDLLSYHMVSSYVETMNQLFASEIQFNWDEYSRTLSIYKDFPMGERVLVDAMVERTEQELLTDRWTKNWIQVYATAQCRYMLADIRGKFATLPGAGGNVSLNASDLRTKADMEVQQCMDDIDNYVVNNKTDFGMASDFVFG